MTAQQQHDKQCTGGDGGDTVRLGLPLIMKITNSGVLVDADTIPGFPTYLHEPSPRLPHRHPIATSSSHRIAPCPSPSHRLPRPSSIAPPILPIASCSSLQVSRRQARPHFPFVPLSCALSLVLDSRPALIRSVLYHFAMIILPSTFMIRNTRVFSRDHLPCLSPSFLPFPFISL